MTEGTSELRAPEEIRTPNLLIRSQMLYPLSYGRMKSTRYSIIWRRREDLNLRSLLRGNNSLAVSPIRPLWHASSNLIEVTGSCPAPEPPRAQTTAPHLC